MPTLQNAETRCLRSFAAKLARSRANAAAHVLTPPGRTIREPPQEGSTYPAECNRQRAFVVSGRPQAGASAAEY